MCWCCSVAADICVTCDTDRGIQCAELCWQGSTGTAKQLLLNEGCVWMSSPWQLLVLWRGLSGRDQVVHLTEHQRLSLTGSPRCYLWQYWVWLQLLGLVQLLETLWRVVSSSEKKTPVILELVLENVENILLTFLQAEEVRNESVLRAASNCCSNVW